MNNCKNIYCPLCFSVMKIENGPKGYGCYCYNDHNNNTEYCWHEIPNWYVNLTSKTIENN